MLYNVKKKQKNDQTFVAFFFFFLGAYIVLQCSNPEKSVFSTLANSTCLCQRGRKETLNSTLEQYLIPEHFCLSHVDRFLSATAVLLKTATLISPHNFDSNRSITLKNKNKKKMLLWPKPCSYKSCSVPVLILTVEVSFYKHSFFLFFFCFGGHRLVVWADQDIFSCVSSCREITLHFVIRFWRIY